MPRRGVGRISFGQITGPNAENVRADWDYLRAVLTPGTMVERYNREWRMGPIEDQGPVVMGRIGYSRQTGTAPVWNEELLDFRERAVLEGQTATFAIKRSTLRIAFQFRPPNIKRRSFTGAFQDLLNESSGGEFWSVEPEFDEEPFDQWRTEIERITNVQVTIRRPNPNYRGRSRVESIIEGTNAQYAKLVVQAQEGESVNLDDELIAQAIAHASVEGKDYGRFTAQGIEPDGKVSKYDSGVDGAPDEVRIGLAPGQREVPWDELRHTLDE